jgi:hypothetical protein
VVLVSAVLILLLGFTNLSIIPPVGFSGSADAGPVFSAFRVWLASLDHEV